MNNRIRFISRLFIKSEYFFFTVVIVVLFDLFFFKKISFDFRLIVEISLLFIYTVFYFLAFFNLLFKTYKEYDIKSEIISLEQQKNIYTTSFKFNEKLSLLYDSYEQIRGKGKYFYLLKTKQELAEYPDVENYFFIIVLLSVGQYSFDFYKPISLIFYFIFYFTFFCFCLRMLYWFTIESKEKISSFILAYIFVIYVLFGIGKKSIIRNYGNEIIGSYFEKAEYRTKYYVNIFPYNEGVNNYRLPADIHVYTETEESDTYEDRYGQEYTESYSTKYIVLEKVFRPDGNILEFNECNLTIGEQITCIDQYENEWVIELTDMKVN
jgi:hypothetical protein